MIPRAWHNALLPLLDPDQYRGLPQRLAELEQYEALSPVDQAAIQEDRLRSLLDHAYKTSPYYRLVFDEMRFRSVDWQYGQPIPLPELSRELVRANMEHLCSRTFRPDQLRRFTSSGSLPTAMWRDIEAHRARGAVHCHLDRLSGIVAARTLEIRAADRQSEDHENPVARLIQERIMGRFSAAVRTPDDETFRSLLDRLNRCKPEALHGPSSLLAMFAEWLRTCGLPWHKPRRVITTGETPSPQARQALRDVFRCRVTAQYICPDIGTLAIECEIGERLHFHPWASYISLVPAGSSSEGSIYRLIVTDLLNHGMPLIRYDSGDCVLFDESPCPCGCWYPSITAVLGPAIENLILPNGSVTAGVPIVTRAGSAFRTVRGVQLIQKTPDTMHVRFAAGDDTSAADRELGVFRRHIEDAFRVPLHWTMERVSEIPCERSGKIRVAICEIAPHRPESRPAL
ncbi:MAG TPA: hypothetical protein VGS02_04265 [Acidobacteriaceae bacterium]|nr:hypothetical protein [Acidobacteriaceae bacterium]